jgi:hypothetical protein
MGGAAFRWHHPQWVEPQYVGIFVGNYFGMDFYLIKSTAYFP